MERKTLATAVLAILALGIGYAVLAQGGPRYVPPGPIVSSEVFLNRLFNATQVYVVMDVRSADPAAKQNILQCGTDFSGSRLFADRNLRAMSIEEERCTGPNGSKRTVEGCLAELKNQTVIYIRPQTSGNQAADQFYSDAILVYIGKNYTLGQCGIRVNALPPPQTNESANTTH